MFEERTYRTYKRTFYSAPQSVRSMVAAFMEPAIIVATFLVATVHFGEPIDRPELTVALLVFALTFPGRDRFHDNLFAAAVDLASSWVVLVVIMALSGYATDSIDFFDRNALLAWIVATPVLQWVAVYAGQKIVRSQASQPHARRSAVVTYPTRTWRWRRRRWWVR